MFELNTELERLRYADSPLGAKIIIGRYLENYGNLTFTGDVQLDGDEILLCGIGLDCSVSCGERTEMFSTLYEVEDVEGRRYQYALSEVFYGGEKVDRNRKLLIGMGMADLLHLLIALKFDNDKNK